MILVDTSAVLAMVDARDQWHARAAEVWEELRGKNERFLMSDMVLGEVVALLRRRAGHKVTVQVGELWMASSVAELVFVDAPLLQQAWALFRRHRTADLSLVDCASFALMRARKIARAFSFDGDFRAMGFVALGLD